MFETMLTPRQRARRALREFFDLSACRVFTVRQQIAWAAFLALLGAVGGQVADVGADESAPAVMILDPVIERASEDYSVYRLRFGWMGREVGACHLVAWHLSRTWTLRC